MIVQFTAYSSSRSESYTSTRGDDARRVIESLIENSFTAIELGETYLIHPKDVIDSLTFGQITGKLPSTPNHYHIEASPEEVESVRCMWVDMSGLLTVARESEGDVKIEVIREEEN